MATEQDITDGVGLPVNAPATTESAGLPVNETPPFSVSSATQDQGLAPHEDEAEAEAEERRPSPADIFLEAAQALESRGQASPAETKPAQQPAATEAADEDQPMPQAAVHTGPERRRVDDLNDRICDTMTLTGTLTSQQLFDLAKPYYDLNPSKSELSQWARARIANLRRKRKVWPTAHMVYGTGTIKTEGHPRDAGAVTATGRCGMWECKGLREAINATEFLEAPRTVYWSWDHGLKKHGLGGGAVAGTAAGPNSSGTSGKRVLGFGIEQKVLFKGEGELAAPVSDGPRGSDTHFESLADISTSEVLSPTSDIRGAMLLTRISSPIGSKRPMSAPGGMSLAPQTTPWSTQGSDDDDDDDDMVDFDNDDAIGSGSGSSPLSPSPGAQSNPEASNRLLMLAMIAKEIQSDGPDADGSPGERVAKKARTAGSRASSADAGAATRGAGGRKGKGPKGPHRGAKYRCGRCGFYPKSCPHDCATGQAQPWAEHMVGKAVAEKAAAADAPRYQARPKQYACGKCGFFPKSVMHDCATGVKTSAPGKAGRATVAAALAPSEAPKRKPPRRESIPGNQMGRPRQYRCGKCGFFPKSTRHDCVTGQASDPSDVAAAAAYEADAAAVAAVAAVVAFKSRDAAHDTQKMPSQNRRRQYKCGKCNFFPKTQPHDCARYQPSNHVAGSPGSASPTTFPDGASLGTPSPAPKLDGDFETPEPVVIRQRVMSHGRVALPPTDLAEGAAPPMTTLPPIVA